MMEFVSMKVAMLDWYDKEDRNANFLKEEDIDRCATERILRNQFFDPLASSESEDDTPNNINWDEIFKNKKQMQKLKLFVPCVRPVPPYPRLSELNPRQHIKFLKVLCHEYPNILEDLVLGKPTRQDFKEFEAEKEKYLKEQEAYKEWAKSLWVTDHCIRALRPKPAVERVYEAEFKVKAQRMHTLPTQYDLAAQISLGSQRNNCDAVLKEELIRVTLAEMPQVQIPEKIEKQFNIITPCTVPEPCQKHPYQIVLPNEHALSMLPITEIHRELATYALNNDTQYIASENALKCLTQWNRHWLLPLSVCDTVGPDGKKVNVMVLDSEFSVHKEPAHMRTYKAFRHLLESALIPSSERERIWAIRKSRSLKKQARASKSTVPVEPVEQDVAMSSDDEDSQLFIDTGDDIEMAEPAFFGFPPPLQSPKADFTPPNTGLCSPKAGFAPPNADLILPEDLNFEPPQAKKSMMGHFEAGLLRSSRLSSQASTESHTRAGSRELSEEGSVELEDDLTKAANRKLSVESSAVPDIGLYSCTCKGTLYERPPLRSFRKWQFRREGTSEKHQIIIHSPHKAKDKTEELVLEPLPEYQIDLGASEQTPDSVRSAALSLALRKKACLLNVRVDGPTGEVVTFERLSSEAFSRRHPDVTRQVISTIHTALDQLRELRPGHYVLQHEPSHGPNAMLLSPASPHARPSLLLNFDSSELIKVDEAHMAKMPPTICSALLPYHKHRRVLPCAFTPYENQVAKGSKKPPPKKKAPPQAIKFPKRTHRKNNKR